MIRLWAWLKGTVARFWMRAPAPPIEQQPPPEIAAEECPEAQPEAPAIPETKARRKYTRHQEDKSQAHYYLGDLLEKLDDYFRDHDFLRRGDPEAAANFEKFGIALCDRSQLMSMDPEPFFIETLPSQGCFYFGRDDEEEARKIGANTIRFVYFQKHKQPVNVQATNGQIYTFGWVYGIKRRHLAHAHVAVFPDRSVKVLKEIQPRYHTFGKGSRKNDTNNRHTIVRMEWGYPAFLRDIVSDYNARNKRSETMDEWFRDFFALMTNAVLKSELDMNVRVKKYNRVATFSINMLRTPYFFADREKTVNHNGNTHKILHIVKPHQRTNVHGEKKWIKAHWRGLRRFTWNGYDVSIGMPGAHYTPLTEFTAIGWNEADAALEGRTDMIDMKEAAAMIDRAVTAQVRARP